MNQFKVGQRVEIRDGPMKGREGVVRVTPLSFDNFNNYRVRVEGVEESIRVPESYLEPLDPTPEQAKRYLCKALEALVTNGKEKLVLMNHSIKWAKKCKELGVRADKPASDPVVPKEGA